MKRTITILGCGSSAGVPRASAIGWGACDPANPKNRRRRCSILVEQGGSAGKTIVLVDTSPDLREQLLSVNVPHIDAVLYTHEHADHTHGIDDLRPLAIDMRRQIPVFAARATTDLLHKRFGYCFETPPGSSYPPILESHLIEADRSLTVDGPGGSIDVHPFALEHGDIDSLGFRFGSVAYAPDVSRIPERSMEALSGLDVLILDALRDKPHFTHLNVQQALEYIDVLKPRRAVLTNMHTDLDYEELRGRLPDNVEPAYDGMKITVVAVREKGSSS